jgi:hypothetical protein
MLSIELMGDQNMELATKKQRVRLTPEEKLRIQQKIRETKKKLNPQFCTRKAMSKKAQHEARLLQTSKSIAEVATEVGLSTRMLYEYSVGKRVPMLGIVRTKYLTATEKYEYNADMKRFFPRPQKNDK